MQGARMRQSGRGFPWPRNLTPAIILPKAVQWRYSDCRFLKEKKPTESAANLAIYAYGGMTVRAERPCSPCLERSYGPPSQGGYFAPNPSADSEFLFWDD